MRARNTAEIVEKKGRLFVLIQLADGSRITADRLNDGRIKYDSPERVPRVMKNTIVPNLFKQIDERQFGSV